jgi:hypothetical protein
MSSVPVKIPGLVPPSLRNAAPPVAALAPQPTTYVIDSVPPAPTQPSAPTQPATPRAYIMIGTPAYGGLAYVSYVQALLSSMQYLAQHNIYIEPCFLTNESLIPRGRNTIVAKFLNNKKFTHLLFIDADVNWGASSIMKLLQHDKDIIGALYPKKGYEWQKLTKNKEALKLITTAAEENRDLTDTEIGHIKTKLMSFVVNLDPANLEVSQGLLQVKHLGTGFMMIKRNALEKMCDAFPELKYDDDINCLQGTENDHLYAFFNCEIHKLSAKKHYLSEDYLFCKRWTDLGNKIYADITVPLTHTGTHSFAGNFAVAHNFVGTASPPVVAAASPPPQPMPPAPVPPQMSVVREPVIGPTPIKSLDEAVAVAPLATTNTTKILPSQVGKITIK